jgi:ABC-type Mn2+/Zn2+ transport system ATPase subunit
VRVMAEEILRIENLHVSVEGTLILKGVNLTIHRGEIHAIMGRNGAGKSTLANVPFVPIPRSHSWCSSWDIPQKIGHLSAR